MWLENQEVETNNGFIIQSEDIDTEALYNLLFSLAYSDESVSFISFKEFVDEYPKDTSLKETFISRLMTIHRDTKATIVEALMDQSPFAYRELIGFIT